ncbi:hypothetical protein NQZ79_g4316 [Umbelopsis isabellina]|nr:hypothetical protein NQZ79_g4316 [Umbelopsis isabellina]
MPVDTFERRSDEQAAPPPYSEIADTPSPSAPPAPFHDSYGPATGDAAGSSDHLGYGSIPSSPVNPPLGSPQNPRPLNPRKLFFQLFAASIGVKFILIAFTDIPYDFADRPPTQVRSLPPPVPYTPDRLRRRRRSRGCCATYYTWTCFVFLLIFIGIKFGMEVLPKCSYRNTYNSGSQLSDITDFDFQVSGTPSYDSWITFVSSDKPHFEATILSSLEKPSIHWSTENRKTLLKVDVDQDSFFPCITVQITVSLPITTQNVRVNAKDMDVTFQKDIWPLQNIEIEGKNRHIVNYAPFKAKRWYLRTSNSKIEGTFQADIVDLATTNGQINVKVTNSSTVTLHTTNSRISGIVEGQDVVSVTTNNGAIDLASLAGEDLTLKTSNGAVLVDKLAVTRRFIGTTNNGRVQVVMYKAADGASLETKTNNGRSSVIIPNSYNTHFELSTSNAAVTVIGDKDVKFEVDKKSYKQGTKYSSGSQPTVWVKTDTSNGKCELQFV